MTTPVTGPFTTEVGGTTPDPTTLYYSKKVGWKQARPLDRVLAYERLIGTVTYKTSGSSLGARFVGASPGAIGLETQWSALEGLCYERFKAKVSNRASVGVSLLELDQSIAMIYNRSTQLFKFGGRLLRGDLLGAASELKMATVPKRASVKKSFANNYLEFHFGWAPLINDVYSAIQVLQSPINNYFIKAGASRNAPFLWSYRPKVVISRPTATYPTSFYFYTEGYRTIYDVGVRMGAEIAVNNSNLWLANQLGLVNPLVLVYEKIPFSFVADWFFNVEQFLSSGTDFYGLSMKNEWNSRRASNIVHDSYKELWKNLSGTIVQSRDYTTDGVAKHVKRKLGLINPTFFVRPFRVWGWRRSAAAVSLLTQQLGGKHL